MENERKRNVARGLGIEITLLLTVAVVSALIVNSLSPHGIALLGSWNPEAGVVSANAKDHPIAHGLEISAIEVVKQIYDRSQAVFVDARSAEAYAEGHIKGALSLPVYQFDDLFAKFAKTVDNRQFIITYCSGRECDDSHELAQLLLEAGYTRVSIFIDGFPAWRQKGYPVE